MHMSDALLSPQVGGAMWAAAGSGIVYSASKIRKSVAEKKIPLMGVMGAFVFAAQMINFSIPGTGSSGHLGGGMILSIVLGPHGAFLVMASILTVQALFFADGGILALGSNIFNLGFFPSFIAYPLVYRIIAGKSRSSLRIYTGSILSALLGLQLGALFVVLQTLLSGISDLPFKGFLLTMLPIHLAIGLVEGVVTAIVVSFIMKAEPDIMDGSPGETGKSSGKKLVAGIGAAALIIGVFLSWFASSNPDGLEWSVGRVAGKEELEVPERGVYRFLHGIQEQLAILPGYGFRTGEGGKGSEPPGEETIAEGVDGGTSLSGVVGAGIVLLLISVFGFLIKKRSSAG